MRIETLLERSGIVYKKSTHAPIFTSQELATMEHVSGYNVAKPVVVKGDTEYAMCLIPACAKLDMHNVAEVLQSFDVRLATEEEMAGLFPDCELGAEPPVGRLYHMKTIVDERLHQDEYIVMQAGKHTESVQVRLRDWERVCRPIVADITL